MRKNIYNDIHFSENDEAFSYNLGDFVTDSQKLLGSISDAKKSKQSGVKYYAKQALEGTGKVLKKFGKAVSNTNVYKAGVDTLKRVDSAIGSNYTIDGIAKRRVNEMLSPTVENGIDIKVKLELTKLNAKLRSGSVPNKIIESATVAFLDAYESTGDDNTARQFYLAKLQENGVGAQYIINAVKAALGPDAIKWIKAAAVIGITIYAVKATGATSIANTIVKSGADIISSAMRVSARYNKSKQPPLKNVTNSVPKKQIEYKRH